MTSSPKPADYSGFPPRFAEPLPTLDEARSAIADRIVIDAIDTFEGALRRHREFDRAINDDHDLDKYNGMAHEHLKAARIHLVRAILARHLDANWDEGRRLELTVHPTCGVARGGRLYQAAVIPAYDNASAGDEPMHCGEPVMQLVVADVAAIPELGTLFSDGRGFFRTGAVRDLGRADDEAVMAPAPPDPEPSSPPPRGPLKAFDTVIRGELDEHYEAFGLTLDDVIAELEKDTDALFFRETTDIAIWEGSILRAIVRRVASGEVRVTYRDDAHGDPPSHDAPADDADDQVEEQAPEDDDEPAEPAAPPRRREAVDLKRPLLPLARTTMTFNTPSEPGFLVSLDVAVYDQCLEGQAASALEGPAELQQAGWHFHSMGPMTIAFRTLC